MKRTSLTTAVIAGLAGVAGIANMAGAVNLSTDGTGSVLIYPYYTVNNNNVTLLSVVNTTSEGKAVKVRFLEALNSREVLDFNLYMSPFDVWTAEVDPVGVGAGVTTNDNSCTVPSFVGTTVPFRNNYYAGINSDTGPTGLSRTAEGYIELIEMGTVNDATKKTLTAITHVNGVPAKCSQVVGAWSTGGYWTGAGNPQTDIGVPDGGLFGSGTIVNVAAGTVEGYNADAIEGFWTTATGQNTAPGSLDPNISEGGNTTAYTFNTSGSGNVSLATSNFTASIDAVSAVFMTDNIYNEYVVDPAYGQATEWVVTFPTKRFYVEGTFPKNSLQLASNPFDITFGSGWGIGYAGTSCSPVTVTPYDREERTSTTPLDFSPPPTQAGTALCWEANVIAFNQSFTTPSGPTAIFGSNVGANVPLPSGFTTGWVNLDFDVGVTPTKHRLTSGNGNVFSGLPATGFAVQETVNSNVTAGVLANYTALYGHKYNRVCLSGQNPCS
ncbi:MAG: hypothetical protein JSS28_12380 [Proteobacteria bacterium]|nr:hypothetical protein [Pseudomonadota bacterium]